MAPKRRRLIYLPGMLSLQLLLPVSLLWLNQHHHFDQQRTIEIMWYDPEIAKPFNQFFPPDRRFTTFNLTSTKEENALKLDSAHVFIKQIISTNDTLRGIKIHFGDTAKYELFVRALDICERENVPIYVNYKRDLWIYGHPGRSREVVCGLIIPKKLSNCLPGTPTETEFEWPTGAGVVIGLFVGLMVSAASTIDRLLPKSLGV